MPREGRLRFDFAGGKQGVRRVPLTLVPFADAGSDGKSNFEVWIPLAPRAVSAAETRLFGVPGSPMPEHPGGF